jgi:hypothetical protein
MDNPVIKKTNKKIEDENRNIASVFFDIKEKYA